METKSCKSGLPGAARNLLVAVCAALVLMIVCCLYVWQHRYARPQSSGQATQAFTTIVTTAPPAPPPVPMGTLAVSSHPDGAQVWLFDRCMGITPATMAMVREGAVTLVFRKEGYKTVTMTTDVRKSATVAVRARLDKIQGPVSALGWTVPGLNMAMVWIPTGAFVMGCADGETNEAPARIVTIRKGFWMGVREVNQEEWLHVMESFVSDGFGYHHPEFSGTNLPIETVSWNDCIEFCARLTARERAACRLSDDLEYRLPTEAEWEYACRAGTTTSFCYGNDLDATMANFDGHHPVGRGRTGDYRKTTMPCGSFAPTTGGLFDMHGNVYEWCADWYGNYSDADVVDPRGPEDGSMRVVRGGSWYDYGSSCRSAFREGIAPDERQSDVGMRLVLGAPRSTSDASTP